MEKKIIAPGAYIQGSGTINNLGKYAEKFGTNGIVIWDDFVKRLVENDVKSGLESLEIIYEDFNKECSLKEINRICEIVKLNELDFIIGIGGGKTLDTAKAVGYYAGINVVIVPTVASSDAPTSALSVIYTPEGEFDRYLFVNSNPSIVIMDLQVIASAPSRLLKSGIGDALSTYFEARACSISKAETMAGATSTNAALKLAELCYEILLRDSKLAVAACDGNVVSTALTNIVEANTYLSGIGFESGGLAAAHAIHNGLTVLPDLHGYLHGEKVAYGVLVQLVLENDIDELSKLIEFNKSLGLPTCLADFGISDIQEVNLMDVANEATIEGETIHNMPFNVTNEDVYAAMVTLENM